MNQLSFFEPEPRTLARRSDPSTSHAAAKRASRVAPNHRNIITAALEHGPATIYDLAARTGLSHVQIARRLPECEQIGTAHPTDQKRDGCRLWAKGRA